MRILLTGSNGYIGKAVLSQLVQKGYSILCIDQQPEGLVPGLEYAQCDITDYARLSSLVKGCEMVVHMAAIPNPFQRTSDEVFRINASGTFNVFRSAAEAGIRRVIQASSINAIGLYYGYREAWVQYFPVDEQHPSETTDAYSFSKQIVEQIGDYFWRREGISSLALRYPAVVSADPQHPWGFSRWNENRLVLRRLCERLLELSPTERLNWLEDARRMFNHLRGQRFLEDRRTYLEMWATDQYMPTEVRVVMNARQNLWALLDMRDAVQAVEKGLVADFEGSYPLFINDHYNWSGIDSNLLIELFYPEVKTIRRPLVGPESLVSIERARSLIGFEPQYSFIKI